MRAQLSFEALLSFAALLSATIILAIAAHSFSGAFLSQIRESQEKSALAEEALALDTASWALGQSSFAFRASGIPCGENRLCARHSPSSERLLSNVSISQDGVLHVQKSHFEPV
jgi:hypothetical protein